MQLIMINYIFLSLKKTVWFLMKYFFFLNSSTSKIIHNNQESKRGYKQYNLRQVSCHCCYLLSVVCKMPTNATCAVSGCNNYYYKTRDMSDGGYPITYHYFPRESRMRVPWWKALNKTDKPSPKNLFICSIHFEPNDFVLTGTKRVLRYDAFPTRNLTLHEISSHNGCDNRINSTECPGEHSYVPVLVISDTEEEEEIVNGNSCLDFSSEEIKLLETKYEQLMSAYEDFKINSEMEIKKLTLAVKHKDEECSKKMSKILSEFLSETEIELAMFLRKQKKESAS